MQNILKVLRILIKEKKMHKTLCGSVLFAAPCMDAVLICILVHDPLVNGVTCVSRILLMQSEG